MPEAPALIQKKHRGTEFTLSSTALIELLTAVHEKGADFRFTATGISMYPTIRKGDIITISPLNGAEPVSGDVVAFRHPESGMLIVHRIIHEDSDTFMAKGDNVPEPDELVPKANLLGVITRVEREGSSLLWPDIRSAPGSARIFFRAQYGFMKLKKSVCCMIGSRMQ